MSENYWTSLDIRHLLCFIIRKDNFFHIISDWQIKRQKMIYHCKFGEFGVLEGQYTEPSGVAVNAQNDIIVADTNNHRVQVCR